MPVRSAAVGTVVEPREVVCDNRWLMAYAAGVGCDGADYLDTTRAEGVVAHPVFPVAPEWDLLTGDLAIDYGLEADEVRRGVHARHDLVIPAAMRGPLTMLLGVTVAGVERTPAGARLTLRFDAAAEDGTTLWTTWLTSLYRGVDVEGPDRIPEGRPAAPSLDPHSPVLDSSTVQLGAGAAHVYTECARIWNPIHTDAAVARMAGLDGIILHGTATLAHGVTETARMVGRPLSDVRGLGGSFRAMVPLPSAISIDLTARDGDRAWFRVLNAAGQPAVRDGYVDFGGDLNGRAARRG